MKIAVVCSRLGYGGAERVAVMWANGFVRRGHETILISNLFEEQTYYVDERISKHSLVSSTKNKIVKWGSSILNVRRVVKDEKPDVIIGVMETCSWVSKIGTIGTHIPVIMTEHYAFDRSPYGSLSKMEKLSKFTLNKIFKIVTVLTEADKYIIGKRLKNVAVLPNPLSLSPIAKRNVNKTNVLLAVGRLDAWYVKGFDVLIRAWTKLVSSSTFLVSSGGWKLQIAGTGSEESLNYLKQLCKENGVEDSVEFLGFRKDVEKLYQDASIFVLSSRYEGFGLVLIEAMSQGCACIACDYKGRQREIIAPNEGECQDSSLKFQDLSVDGPKEGEDTDVSNYKIPKKLETSEKPEPRNSNPDARLCRFRSYDGERTRNISVEACETGILCEPDDVESLAAGIRKMIEDDEYRESVRVKAVERSKYYSIENTIDRWEKLLDEVVN